MQVFRTSRGQTLPAVEESSRGQSADPALQEAVDDFFNQDLSEEPVAAPNPFDLMFSSTSGGPSRSDFAPSRVVTLEQWLMANPEAFKSIDLYKERVQQILENRYLPRRGQFQEILNRGGMSPNEARVIQQVIADIDASIAIMRQEIEKAENRIGQQREVYPREIAAMGSVEDPVEADLNGDGYIGDPNDDNAFRIAERNGKKIVVDKAGNLAIYPNAGPNYTPSLLAANSVNLIAQNRHDAQPNGKRLLTYDETFEINPNSVGGTFNAGIDVAVPEGFWVEAGEDGKPLVEYVDSEHLLKPKPMELIDGRYGQRPPSEEERENWVFVRAAVLEIESEPATHVNFADGPGNEVNDDGSRGGFVHYVFKGNAGGKDVTIMRMRFQGVETRSYHPLVSDGSNYIAATSVGIAVNGGEGLGEDSRRISPIHVDASRFISTGKVIPAASQAEFLDALGISSNLADQLNRYSDVPPPEGGLSDRDRALAALHDNLYGGFLLNSSEEVRQTLEGEPGLYATVDNEGNLDDPEDVQAAMDRAIPSEIASRFLNENGTIANTRAYIPPDPSSSSRAHRALRSGLISTGLRGVIEGAGNDIIVVPAPDDESLMNLLPPGSDPIDPSNAAYGTVVEAGSVGRNIIVSQGGDIYAKNATFFWRELPDKVPVTRRDMIFIQSEEVNRPSSDNRNNPRLFFHIGDSNPEMVAIANGEDLHEDDIQQMEGNNDRDANPPTELPAGNDDWFESANENATTHSASAHDILGGLDWGNLTEGLAADINTATADAWQAIMTEVIRRDPLSDFQATAEEGWALPAYVVREDEEADAFFNEFDFFSDQEPDWNPASMREEA